MDAFLPANDVDEVIDLDHESDTQPNGAPLPDTDQLAPQSGSDDDDDDDDDDAFDPRPDPNDETAIHVFRQHKEPVLKVCLSKSGSFIVTGGQDDAAFVWQTSTGNVLFQCPGHRDSVNCAAISCKDTFVATADMSGLIQVFGVPGGKKVFEYEVDDIHWLQWHPLSDSTLVVGTECGSVWLLNVLDSKIKTLQGPATAATCGKMSRCGTKLMTGYEDGSVRMWDLKTSAVLFSVKDNQAHASTVTCIDFQEPNQAIAATGSTAGSVKLINLLTGNVLTTITCGEQRVGHQAEGHDAEEEDEQKSVEAVAFCSVLQLLATATVSGVIEVWDVSSFQRRCVIVHEEGVSGIRWDLSDHTKLHSAGLDGCFNTWDGRDGRLLKQRYCHTDHILDFDITHADGDDVVATASDDTTCRVFYMNKY